MGIKTYLYFYIEHMLRNREIFMKWLNITKGYFLVENPEPHCAINHNPDRSITARVHLAYQNTATDYFIEKTIGLRFNDNGIGSFWSHVDS